MKCTNCNHEFDNSYPSCPKCGTKNIKYVKPEKKVGLFNKKSLVKNIPKTEHIDITVSDKIEMTNNIKKVKLKKCPFCAEEILFEAKKCKHCGERLDNPIVESKFSEKNEVTCPACGSHSVQTTKDNYDAGGGCCGWMMCGPIGLLLGAPGSNIYNVCLKCGKKWLPGNNKIIGNLNLLPLWHCHKLPERSFHIHNKPMPLCARCFGLIVGLVCSIFLIFFNLIPAFEASVLFILLMLFDWGLQQYFKIKSNNIRRLITGALCSTGFVSISYYLISKIIISFV